MPRSIRYEDFALKITADGGDGFAIRVLKAPYGGKDRPLRIPYTARQAERLVLQLESLVRGSVRHGRPESTAAREALNPAMIGANLFQALFGDSILDSFQRSLGRVSTDTRTGLRLRLLFDLEGEGVQHLCSLPWEMLYGLPNGQFLAKDLYTPIIRYLDVQQFRGALEPIAELQVLVVMASPQGSAPLNLARERERLESSIGAQPRIHLRFLEEPTLRSLRRALREENFHALHFMGHGSFEAYSGQGALLFETDGGEPYPVSGNTLGTILNAAPTLRLVFLNACESAQLARRGGQDPYTGVASALIKAGIPAVLAMQFPISDTAAITFSEAFYGALNEGDPVEGAVAEGRVAILQDQPHGWEWATPVLFLGVEDGDFFGLSRGGPPPIQTLADLEGVDPQKRRELLERYQEQAKEQPENAKYHFSLGLLYLDLGLHEPSMQAFEKTLEVSPGDGATLQYLAVASIRGRVLRTLRLTEVKRIEALLEASCSQDPENAIPWLLRALIKTDFYIPNGIRMTSPTVEEMLKRAAIGRLDNSELVRVVRHIPSASSGKIVNYWVKRGR